MKSWLLLLSEHAIVAIDAMALIVVIYGAAEAFIQCMRLVLFRNTALESRAVWLRFSRLLVAALTFQLAADIIETSIFTNWDSLGRIAVIAIIRTMLNFFLERDLAELRQPQQATGSAP